MTFLKNRKNLIVWLTALAFLLRLFQIGEWSFWHDEALTVLLARQPISQLIAITAADVHPPLYFLIVKLFMLFGQTEVTVRLVSALWGAASVFMLYWTGKDLFDESAGLAGAFILAIAPLHLFYAQEARMYTQLLFFTIFSAWCLFRALGSDDRLWWGGLILGLILAAYTAYFAFPVIAAMALYVIFVDRRRKRIAHFLLSMGIVVALYLPWIGVFLSQTQAVIDSYWIARPNPLILFTTLSGFFVSYTLPSFWIAVSLAATLLVVFMTLNSARHALMQKVDVQPLIWLLLWIFVPLLGTFLVSQFRSIFQLRTVLTATPALYLLIAWGITRAQSRPVNLVLFLPTLALMLISAFNFYFNPAFAKPSWREASQYVEDQAQAGDVVLHTSDGSFLPFLVYDSGGQHTLLLPDPQLVVENIPSQAIVAAVGGAPQSIDEAVDGYRRAWLVVGLDQAVEYQRAQKELFDSRFNLVDETKIQGIPIFVYSIE